MGISNYTGRTTLSSKVLEKLIEEQQVLKGLDPAILIGPRFALWPTDQEVINAKTLADYFTQLTHLPRLLGPDVLPACLAQGIHRGIFGYALGDGEKKQFDTNPVRHDCCIRWVGGQVDAALMIGSGRGTGGQKRREVAESERCAAANAASAKKMAARLNQAAWDCSLAKCASSSSSSAKPVK